jgi:hypothetical protein
MNPQRVTLKKCAEVRSPGLRDPCRAAVLPRSLLPHSHSHRRCRFLDLVGLKVLFRVLATTALSFKIDRLTITFPSISVGLWFFVWLGYVFVGLVLLYFRLNILCQIVNLLHFHVRIHFLSSVSAVTGSTTDSSGVLFNVVSIFRSMENFLGLGDNPGGLPSRLRDIRIEGI